MKTSLPGLAIPLLLLLMADVAQAADRSGNAGWRLGERSRDGYTIYRRDRGNWYRVPGSAIAVGDGWVLGNKRESGGYAIYRWNGRGWDQAPGGAVEIGGSYSRPWVINNRGQRFNWNGYDWNPSGYVGNARNSFRGNTYRGNNFGREFDRRDRYRDRDYRDRNRRDRDYRGRYRQRDFYRGNDYRNRYRFFNRRDRSWDPYRFDERRRFNKRGWRW